MECGVLVILRVVNMAWQLGHAYVLTHLLCRVRLLFA